MERVIHINIQFSLEQNWRKSTMAGGRLVKITSPCASLLEGLHHGSQLLLFIFRSNSSSIFNDVPEKPDLDCRCSFSCCAGRESGGRWKSDPICSHGPDSRRPNIVSCKGQHFIHYVPTLNKVPQLWNTSNSHAVSLEMSANAPRYLTHSGVNHSLFHLWEGY